MLLEDFFTLTEMKDGLATLTRVEELLSVMQNHNNCEPNSLGDATRQWTTVASILASTENNDCLDHFVQLNGLLFLNHWLKEAQKWSENNSDCSVEELINAVLGALDRLPVKKEKLSASGISETVKHLLCYRCHNILEMVRTLLDKWDHVEDSGLTCQNLEEHGTSCNDERKPSAKTSMTDDNAQSLYPAPEVPPSDKEPGDNVQRYSNSPSVDTTKDVKLSSKQISPHHDSNFSDANMVSGEFNSSVVSCQHQESSCTAMQSVCPAAGEASTGRCVSSVGDGSDISRRKDTFDGPQGMEIEVNVRGFSPCRTTEKEVCTVSERDSSSDKEAKVVAGDTKKLESDPELTVNKGMDCMISHGSLKPAVDANVSEPEKGSEKGFGYCEMDALEVARQVAIEVEREVVDYREPSCSSPEGVSLGKMLDANNPDIAENNVDKPASEQQNENESNSRKDLPENSARNSMRTSDDVDGTEAHGPESPKSSLIQGSVSNADKNKCVFDLNEDICHEEADCQIVSTPNQNKVSTPIPVAASKGSPGFPVTPLHFQGTLGWRGSAATSAFRPASPWRTSDGEKTVSGPKQNSNFLKIDLNVAEGEDDVAADQLDKLTPVSSSIPSRESSMEVNSRRAERLKLDLNRIGDEDALQNQSPFWRPHLQNTDHCLSPASSSSSRQPSMRDFDLNDHPSLFDPCGSNSHSKSSKETGTYGSYTIEDSVITVMGSKLPLERKGLVNESPQSFFGNGLGVHPAIGARGPVPYHPMQPPAFGYNGLAMGPAICIPPTFCGPGPIPYMMDSRGTTVIPQMLGSVGLGCATPARTPFVMNLAGSASGLNAVAVSRPSFDLNTVITPADGEGRTVGNIKQFMQGSSGLMEEQMRSASQPAGSGMALKRKEPDCGWEPCTFGYKQYGHFLHAGLRNRWPIHHFRGVESVME